MGLAIGASDIMRCRPKSHSSRIVGGYHHDLAAADSLDSSAHRSTHSRDSGRRSRRRGFGHRDRAPPPEARIIAARRFVQGAWCFREPPDAANSSGRRGRGIGRQPRRGSGVRGHETPRTRQNIRAERCLVHENSADIRLRREPRNLRGALRRRACGSEAWVAQSGAMPIHAFDQHETLLGQASVGVELEQQAPAITTLLVAVGGGGLLAGIAAW
jgi:hypothetical protein